MALTSNSEPLVGLLISFKLNNEMFAKRKIEVQRTRFGMLVGLKAAGSASRPVKVWTCALALWILGSCRRDESWGCA